MDIHEYEIPYEMGAARTRDFGAGATENRVGINPCGLNHSCRRRT